MQKSGGLLYGLPIDERFQAGQGASREIDRYAAKSFRLFRLGDWAYNPPKC